MSVNKLTNKSKIYVEKAPLTLCDNSIIDQILTFNSNIPVIKSIALAVYVFMQRQDLLNDADKIFNAEDMARKLEVALLDLEAALVILNRIGCISYMEGN